MRIISFHTLILATCVLLLCTAPVAAQVNLQVYSNPSGALVSVDNFWYYDTPATITSVGSGWHAVQVSMDGYQTAYSSQYCDDKNGGIQTCVVNIDLAPNPPSYGWLEITPFGADVYVDGMYQGNGDMSFPLAPGSHTLTMKKPGYYDYTTQFPITAGETTRRAPGMTPYPQQQPEYGSLQIDSDPAGASVYLDNAYKGVEPATGAFYITDLRPGTYTLRLAMPDYQTWSQQVTVQAGIVNDIHATLVPNAPGPSPDATGQIFAYSVPNGVNVFVDNAYRGITPITLRDIPAGSHSVTFRMPGYQDSVTTAVVNGGTVVNVPATLAAGPQPTGPAPAPQPTKSPVAGWIPIIAAGAGLLVVMGRR